MCHYWDKHGDGGGCSTCPSANTPGDPCCEILRTEILRSVYNYEAC